MNPDLVDAVGQLRERGLLSPEEEQFLSRVARGRLVSVRLELQAVLYAGVALVVAGVGVFLRSHYLEIGPAAISVAIGLAAIGCLAWVARKAPEFSWGEAPPASVALDYILLLGALLLAADLAYVEAQFRLLGAHWPYHLLIVSAVYVALAYRFDSRSVLSLALTSFAAWRGVSASTALHELFSDRPQAVRANALACGALFLAAGLLSKRLGRKAHFEPVYGNVGLLLLYGALASGLARPAPEWGAFDALLLLGAAAGAALSVRRRRRDYLALSGIAGYAGLLRLVGFIHDDQAALAAALAITVGAFFALRALFHAARSSAR